MGFFKHKLTFTKLIIEDDQEGYLALSGSVTLTSSEKSWEKLFKAFDPYSIVFIDLMYCNGGHLKIINEALEEDKFKNCSELVKSAVDTILKCLEIDADYFSKNTFWDIVKKFIPFFINAKDRKILNNILSGKNLLTLAMQIEAIIDIFSNDLEEAEKNALNTLHAALCDSFVNLLGVLIVYNKLNPTTGTLWAKEAIIKWSKSYPNTKTSILDEWENIEIPSWKKGKRYYIKNINSLDKGVGWSK